VEEELKRETCRETYSISEQGSEDEPGVLLVLALTFLCSPAKPSWLSGTGARRGEAARGGGSSLPQHVKAALAANL